MVGDGLVVLIVSWSIWHRQPVREVSDRFLSDERIAQELAERGPFIREWRGHASDIAEKTGDAEAKEIATFLRERCALCVPTESGCTVIEQVKDGWICVVLLRDDDRKKGALWQRFLDAPQQGAMFIPDAHQIVLRADAPVSPTFKGLILLHKGFLAKRHLKEPTDMQDPQAYCASEREAYVFQNRLAAALGGRAYEDVVKREIERQDRELRKIGRTPVTGYTKRAGYDPALEQAFGTSTSDLEKDCRQTQAWMDAAFRLIDREVAAADRNEAKDQFLFSVYKAHGLFP